MRGELPGAELLAAPDGGRRAFARRFSAGKPIWKTSAVCAVAFERHPRCRAQMCLYF
jgi:hypothetical protein